jgi:hypothetical protein
MKLPDAVIIPLEKLTAYLLVPQAKNDKSKFLAQAGFTQKNPDILETAIRQLISENEAVQDRVNEYGIHYRVTGHLRGVSGDLDVVTIWIHGTKDDRYRFITLKPNKE